MGSYSSMKTLFDLDRREFLRVGGAVGAGVLLGQPLACASDEEEAGTGKPATNVSEVLDIPRTATSMPGPFPGRVVQVAEEKTRTDDGWDGALVARMFDRGLTALTGEDAAASFARLFTPDDVIGIKVNPVGAGLISTRLEVVDAIVDWLLANGVPPANLVIWDRFDSMLAEAGFTAERYPGLGLEGLQMLAEDGWRKDDGTHVSAELFDPDVYYWADVPAPDDDGYLSQHVFNDRKSYFGRLVTEKLTKIINVPVFKNTGNGVSMATKNLGYAAICNTGRLHRPLFFDVCTEVLAFPALRDKVVLNVMDGLVGQYDGGPGAVAEFTWDHDTLYFATDPFAMDAVGHALMVEKRKEKGVEVNEHPRYTEYLLYAERLGLGVGDPARIERVEA